MIEFSRMFPRKKEKEQSAKDSQGLSDKLDYSSLKRKVSEKDKNAKEPVSGEVSPSQKFDSDNKKYAEAKELYGQALSIAIQLTQASLVNVDTGSISDTVKKLIDFIGSSSQELVEVMFAKEYQDENFLSINRVNVCILALEVGLGLSMSQAELIELGVASFFHDIGVIAHIDIISQPRKLRSEEYQKIKKHPLAGRKIIESSGCVLSTNILAAVEQEHERMDGSGYPKGIDGDSIHLYAKIIGFTDVYESLTQQRPYRESYNCLRAIKFILKNKKGFDSKVIKAFLERVGFSPRGTLVELSTKEVARVIEHNSKYPMAPKVLILLDSQGKKLAIPKEVDLSAKSTIHITQCL